MNLDLTVPYCAVVVDFAECFVASFKEEEAVSSLRRKAESPWFEEEMREWSRVEVSDMLSTMERDQYDKFRLHLPKLDYRTAERIIISIVDDGWWWMMMDDDGWWWMMMDDDGWSSMYVYVYGWGSMEAVAQADLSSEREAALMAIVRTFHGRSEALPSGNLWCSYWSHGP